MRLHPGVKFSKACAQSYNYNFSNDDLTPSVLNANVFLCASGHTAARSITNFDDAVDGQILIIIGGNPTYKTTLSDGTYLKLNGNWVEALNSTITLIYIGGVWYEICRSVNA